MQTKWGRSDCESWFSTWCPGQDIPDELSRELGDFKAVAASRGSKSGAGPETPFCEALEPILRYTGDKYSILSTANNLETESSKKGTRGNVCIYEKEAPTEEAYPALEMEINSDESDSEEDAANRQAALTLIRKHAYSWAITSFDVRSKPSDCPFEHRPGPVLFSVTSAGSKARAQITEHAAQLLRRQHRTFVYTALVVRNLVWLMRWDRAGVVVADGFDYTAEPDDLFKFVWRILSAGPAEQGYDTTARRVEADSEALRAFRTYRDAQPEGSWHRRYASDVLDASPLHPIYEITCPDAPGLAAEHLPEPDTRRTYTYLIGKALSGSYSPSGRGGRGFVAYDVDRKRLVFVKDAWRANCPTVHSEFEAVRTLNSCNVKYVPTVIAGGDVAGPQTTRTQILLPHAADDRGKPAERIHHRVVFYEVGRPLETHEDAMMLVYYIYNALLAHCMAYKKAGILHRDVSMSNILINIDKTKAFLNDWDLCAYKSDIDSGLDPDGRVGTWPYMSGVLTRYPYKPTGVEDDIESFVYVLEVACLRFHRHEWTREGPVDLLEFGPLAGYYSIKFHIKYAAAPGVAVGDPHKFDHMLLGRPGDFSLRDGSHLNDLLSELYTLGQIHYMRLNRDELKKQWGPRDDASEPRATRSAEVGRRAPAASNAGSALNLLFSDGEPPRKIQKLTSAGNWQPTATSSGKGFADHKGIVRIFKKYAEMEWPSGISPTTDQLEGAHLLGIEREMSASSAASSAASDEP